MRASTPLRTAVTAAALAASQACFAQESQPAEKPRETEPLVYLDDVGLIRWRAGDEELRLFGANYCAFSGQDYRMAGRMTADRKAMIREDMAHFARMGWNGLRLCSWGDWENADEAGNLIENEHVDLLDFLIAEAKTRGVYMLLTPIHTYNAGWPDELDEAAEYRGFSRKYEREELGTNKTAIKAQTNYIRQLLNHINPYTGLALKDDPNILLVEMINEPVHHPDDLQGQLDYINALVAAVRDTGSLQITFHNVSQDFRIAPAITASDVDGVSFGWYPTGLGAQRTLKGSFLPAVDAYPGMLRDDIRGMPRIVYEFDQADHLSATMFPAIARTYRSVGAQFASIFAYDMLQTAPSNLGWQTHFLNLVHTPQKAVSAVIAGEAMRRLPAYGDFGSYPQTLRFGDFHLDPENDVSVLSAADAYMNAGATDIFPPAAERLQRIAGFKSSPLIRYEGTGAYFLDKIEDGLWRLELYPDSVHVTEPFAQPRPDRTVSRLYWRERPIKISLPDLGNGFHIKNLSATDGEVTETYRARNGMATVSPGVWLLSRRKDVDLSALPQAVNGVGLREFYANAPQEYRPLVLSLSPEEFRRGGSVQELNFRVATDNEPEEASAYLRKLGEFAFARKIPLKLTEAYVYAGALTDLKLEPGVYEYVACIKSGEQTLTFPDATGQCPGEWPQQPLRSWRFSIIDDDAPLSLFVPLSDLSKLSFVRPAETVRAPIYEFNPGGVDMPAAIEMGVPDVGPDSPDHYAAGLFIGEKVDSVSDGPAAFTQLSVNARCVNSETCAAKVLLIERDGSSWSADFEAGADWRQYRFSLSDLAFDKSIHIPSPFPGLWNYWKSGPEARTHGAIRLGDVERLELRVRGPSGADSKVAFGRVWLSVSVESGAERSSQ